MLEREVKPEILDSLPADDPAGIRSRRDLRLINALMGNGRWAARTLMRWNPGGRVTELGAGDGSLSTCLHALGMTVTGADLAPRPAGLPDAVDWCQGDVFDGNLSLEGGAVTAALFLHHFEAAALARLGEMIRTCEFLCFVEPLRSRVALAEGYALFPLVNQVTRHDMMISIRAGFLPGELPSLLGLDRGWDIYEEATLLGAYRMTATKR